IALVHLGAGLDFLGLGLDQVPPQVLEEILEKYPRMKFKSQFRGSWSSTASAIPPHKS
ncbi:MAG: hypothetical protein QOJ58_4669, partial [Alphaproteobacteria bacterium]|nr:hypothetical protein [Alphaproteobacteria bacterium]